MKTVELFEKMFGQQNSDGSAQKWYSQPEWYCAKAYRSTQKIGSEILTFKDPLIANQWKEVSEILQRENIAEFIYGAKDPDLYLHLLELQNLGWRLKQMCVVPISPFQATHNLSSPAIVLAFAPDETVGVNAGTSKTRARPYISRQQTLLQVPLLSDCEWEREAGYPSQPWKSMLRKLRHGGRVRVIPTSVRRSAKTTGTKSLLIIRSILSGFGREEQLGKRRSLLPGRKGSASKNCGVGSMTPCQLYT